MFKGYRTYLVSIIVAVFGTLEMANWSEILDNPQAGMVAVASAIVMAVLRTVTTTPPGVSSRDDQ
jgi:hypothetical protein